MAMCPSCGSSRLRSGYRKTAIVLRAVGVRTLLCDDCNCEFRGFSPLPPKRVTRRERKADVFNKTQDFDLEAVGQPGLDPRRPLESVKFDRNALPFSPDDTGVPVHMPTLVQAPIRPYAITEAPDLVQTEEPLMRLREDLQQRKRKWANHPCPQCNSTRTRRRHRSSWERLVSYFSDKRPYICSDCEADFFAHPSEQPAQKLAYTDEDLVKSSCFNQQRESDNA
jgi:hypothetical protein